MKTLDHGRKVTHVFGRQPLRYLQDGYGFDAAERCLGRFNDNGEPLAGNVDMFESEAPSGEGEPDDGQAPDASGSLDALGIKALKAMAKDAGIPRASTLNKAALIEALEAADNPTSHEGGEG